MNDTKQTEALKLADTLDSLSMGWSADVVRRLHAENTTLQQGYDAAVDALKDMAAEFRALDLPYGSKAYAKATAVIYGHPQVAAPAAVAGPSEAVAYLDIGAGGYLDLGSDLSDESLRKLPKGRHMLAIVGTYGVDGYVPVAAPTTQAAPVAQEALDAAFEAVRHRLCGLQRYSFVLDDDCVVRRVQDRTGNWIEFDAAHEIFDPVAVDAARAQAKKGGAA